VLEYEPDMVLAMENINDLTVNYYAAIAGTPIDAHYRVKFGQDRFTADLDEDDVVLSRLLHSIRSRVVAHSGEPIVPSEYDITRGLQLFQRNLANNHALVANRGATFVLLTMPTCDSEAVYRQVEIQGRRQFSDPLPSYDRFQRDFAAYNAAVRQVAQQRNIAMVDMARQFGSSSEFFSDFVHYNAAGSRRFGELVAASLVPLIEDKLAKRRSSHADIP
jgi:hypothetical protein